LQKHLTNLAAFDASAKGLLGLVVTQKRILAQK